MKLQTYKKIVVFAYAYALLLLTGCSRDTLPENDDTRETEVDCDSIYRLTEADMDVSAENAEEVLFEDEQVVYAIDKPGDYRLQGKYDGQIQIDVQDQIVHLILEDVEMKSQAGPVIYVQSAAKVVITIPEGSSCILMDSAYYDGFEEAQACIFSVDDLTINGRGNLQVYGYYEDAIRTKDTLKLLDINLSVQAKDTGLRGNDGVVIRTNELNIQSEGTGIYTKQKEDKDNRGFVDIEGGNVSIIAGRYGIEADGTVFIHDCKVDIDSIVRDITCLGEQFIEEGCLE